ncbi:TPA: TVP38/TMEM64 family protein [Staphylococcus aureus]|nr:TVP38/TMEM64 family protein [Staphylococcus aureus]
MSFHQVEEWFEIFRQFGYLPGFILLYIRAIIPVFPFTPNTLINFVASLSHIRPKYYFIVLASSKLVSTIILGYLGKEITTILTHPLRGILMLVVLVVFWIVGKKLEQHFMGSKKE